MHLDTLLTFFYFVVRGMQTYAECCAEGFISIRSTEQVQVNYKDKDTKTTFKTHSQNIHKNNKKIYKKNYQNICPGIWPYSVRISRD